MYGDTITQGTDGDKWPQTHLPRQASAAFASRTLALLPHLFTLACIQDRQGFPRHKKELLCGRKGYKRFRSVIEVLWVIVFRRRSKLGWHWHCTFCLIFNVFNVRNKQSVSAKNFTTGRQETLNLSLSMFGTWSRSRIPEFWASLIFLLCNERFEKEKQGSCVRSWSPARPQLGTLRQWKRVRRCRNLSTHKLS